MPSASEAPRLQSCRRWCPVDVWRGTEGSKSYKHSLRDPVARVLWERSVERRRLPDGDAPRGWEVESALIRPGAPLDVVPRTSHSDENSRMPTLTTSFYQEALEFQDCLGHLWSSEQGWPYTSSGRLYPPTSPLCVPVRLEEAAGTQKSTASFPAGHGLLLTERDREREARTELHPARTLPPGSL
ncbi:uncharacterized protein [Bos indicus]|uniref:Uncharacterized protein isoform X2 n=1 Tax=Bos indicus TaxID=9915 RepID=A0ABM4RGL5_BOSIN